MKKIMLAAGDSFTYGEELNDRNNCWASLVSDRLNLSLTNLGEPGGSNYRAVRLLMEQDISNVELVCIGWSHFDRMEVSDELGTYDTWPGGYRKKYREEAPWRSDLIDYISRHHNDDYLYCQYLMNIVLVQSWLKVNNIKYVMMDAFGNHQDPRRQSDKFKLLLSQIDSKHYLGWPNESMIEWTERTPQGWGHFLDEGHKIVAEKILNHLTNSK